MLPCAVGEASQPWGAPAILADMLSMEGWGQHLSLSVSPVFLVLPPSPSSFTQLHTVSMSVKPLLLFGM